MSTAAEKLKCVERELNYRRYVFPNRVAAGKMTQQDADKQIRIMEEIAEDYRALKEREAPDLFGSAV